MIAVRIYFDGGCLGGKKAYGSYQVESDEPRLNHKGLRQDFGQMTSNQAEYMALIRALDWLSHRADPPNTNLHIFTDSELVRGQVAGGWKCKVAHLILLLGEVRSQLKPYHHWQIEWRSRVENVRRFGH